MSFLGNLGVDTGLLVAQILNFILLLWILKKFVYTPIVKRIEEDERELSSARIEEEKLEQEKKAIDRKEKLSETRAKERAEAILKEAEEIAHDIREQAAQEAAEEKLAVIAQVKRRLSEIEDHGNL